MIITLDKTYYARVDSPLLGYMGETESRSITVQGYQTEGADRYILRFSYADGAQYDVDITDGAYTVQASLLRAVGNVKCQVLAVKSTGADTYEYVKKSNVFNVAIKPSVGGDEPVPTYEETVAALEKVLAAEIAADECIAARDTAVGAADTAVSSAGSAAASVETAVKSAETATENAEKTAADRTAVESAKAEVLSARDTAVGAADTATEKAQTAIDNAATASTVAATAAAANNAAQAARNDAEQAATAAEDNKTTAVNAAQTATRAADTAVSARDTAVTARDTVVSAQADVTAKAQTVATSAAQVAKDKQTVQAVAESIPADYSDLSASVDELKSDLGNLQNYTFHENLVYGRTIALEKVSGNNLTVAKGIALPVGDYVMACKFLTEDAEVFPTYAKLYSSQANYISDMLEITENGEYLITGEFSVAEEKSGNLRLDFHRSDSARKATVLSYFVCEKADGVLDEIQKNSVQRKNVITCDVSYDYLPDDICKKSEAITVDKYNALKNVTFPEAEPIFDLVKDYRNRNYTICLIGDSTSDGDAGPAIGIYTALSHHQKSGELLEGVTVIDRGSNGSTAEAYIGNYTEGSGSLYTAIQDNADVYVVCLGINDVRQGNCDKDTLKSRIKFIVDEILANTKARVILRTPNSLGTDDTSEQYIIPYTSAQEYTDIMWNAYDELKNEWDCTRVRILDMQTLIFGRSCVPSADNTLMGDVLHPTSNQSSKLFESDLMYGMNTIGTVIAYALGKKEKPNLFECMKAIKENPKAPYMVYPLILDTEEYLNTKIYSEWTGNFPCKSSYVQFFNLQKENVELKTGDILRFGNEFCKVYNGEALQNVGTLLHIPISFTEEEIEKSKNVWHVSVYRLSN